MKKLTFVLIIALLLVVIAVPVYAQGQETCPEGDGWVKFEPLSGTTVTLVAPEGKLIVGSCSKIANTLTFETYDPAQTSVTLISTVFNSPDDAICTAPGVPHPGCSLQEFSHASLLLMDDPTETPTETPTGTPTPDDPTETPTPDPSVTPTPSETETPVVEVEVSTGGSLLPTALIIIGLASVAGIQLVGRRKK